MNLDDIATKYAIEAVNESDIEASWLGLIKHKIKTACQEMLTDSWRYGHGEIESACGGETALLIRAQVTKRRVQIDQALAKRAAAMPNDPKLSHGHGKASPK